MNKGLEVIEAHWLFGLPPERIRVLIHPQSIVHALVEFCDGSVKAQLAVPDMRLPIAYALSYPDREPLALPRLDLSAIGKLEFESPDLERFPCLRLALEALAPEERIRQCSTPPTKQRWRRFLSGHLRFVDIPAVVEAVLERMPVSAEPDLETVLAADAHARSLARLEIQRRRSSILSPG
jgi:1-deoxy-D-xylulose-5-phosphate reductoisomerase